jgi:hypothetical protein
MKKMMMFLLCPILMLIACNKEPDFNYPEGTVGISTIINYPTLAIKGERLIILDQGTPYTDSGAVATLKGEPVEPVVTGSVDTNTPGVYELNYSASNPEGFSVTDFRTVVVIANDETVNSNNFSGSYNRAATGVDAVWTKVGRGVYQVDNPGGAAVGVGFIVTLVNYAGNEIAIPRQEAFDPSIGGMNVISSNTESYEATATPIAVHYALTAGGYGDQLRDFVKK